MKNTIHKTTCSLPEKVIFMKVVRSLWHCQLYFTVWYP